MLVLSACNHDKDNDIVSVCDSDSVLLRSIDVSIDGLGFFAFETNGETLYSRRGDFCVDQTGQLIDKDGQYVLGFQPISDTVFNTGALTRIALPITNDAGGTLADASIDGAGVVQGIYTRGGAELAAQLALVTFPSPQGLEPVGAVMCRETFNSGGAVIGQSGIGGVDQIRAGLEDTYDCDQGRFDIEIIGNGFFRLNSAGTIRYDNAIILGMDRDGYFVDQHGYRITGYAADEFGNVIPSLVDLHSSSTVAAPQATSYVGITANLDADAGQPATAPFNSANADSYNFHTSANIYDSMGQVHTLDLYFVQSALADNWHLYAYIDETLMQAGGAAYQTVTFAGGAVASDQTLDFEPVSLTNGAARLNMTLDVSNLSQSSSAFLIDSMAITGQASGVVMALIFGTDGTIQLGFSNGRRTFTHARLVLATFADPRALTISGDGETLVESGASGPPNIDVPGTSGSGTIAATAH